MSIVLTHARHFLGTNITSFGGHSNLGGKDHDPLAPQLPPGRLSQSCLPHTSPATLFPHLSPRLKCPLTSMDCFGVPSRYLILARYQWYLDSLLGKFTFFPHPRPWLEPIGAPHSTSPAAETGDFAAPGHARRGCQGRRADVSVSCRETAGAAGGFRAAKRPRSRRGVHLHQEFTEG